LCTFAKISAGSLIASRPFSGIPFSIDIVMVNLVAYLAFAISQ
jgi:hypothetical protein